MEQIKTVSGANLCIGIAPFKDCMHLKNVIERELSKNKIDLSSLDLKSTDLSALINPILSIDSSDAFMDAFFKVAIKSTYNDEKITQDIFEDEKARIDFYDVMINVIRINLAPFFKGLVSSLKQAIVGFKTKNIPK